MSETFEEFKNSFFYGSRTDLSFKFLKALSEEEAGEFFSQVFTEVGALYDGATPERLIDLVYEWQVKAYQPKPGIKRSYLYEDRPFHPLSKPLRETTVGLVTSSGHFAGDDPPSDSRAHQDQEQTVTQIDEFLKRAPDLSEIPINASAEGIVVRHPGYDTRSATRDFGVSFPFQVLADEAARGKIGALSANAYSFVGACSQGRLRKELDHWLDRWQSAGIEALFLVPV